MTVALGPGGSLSATVGYVGSADLIFDVTGYFVPDGSRRDLRARSTPSRLLDTRVGNGLAGPFVANTPRTFQVAGRGGVPASAVAVTGNLAVTGQSGPGFVYLGPTAVPQPDQLDPELPGRRHPGDRGDGGPRPGRDPERDRSATPARPTSCST